jgi:hypothetical protein
MKWRTIECMVEGFLGRQGSPNAGTPYIYEAGRGAVKQFLPWRSANPAEAADGFGVFFDLAEATARTLASYLASATRQERGEGSQSVRARVHTSWPAWISTPGSMC